MVRLVKGSWVTDASVSPDAFRLRENETGVSINWLDYFEWLSKGDQIARVRNDCHLQNVRNSHKYAELNVGSTIEKASGILPGLSFQHDPQPNDPSHSLMMHETVAEIARYEEALLLLTECVVELHPAKAPS